MPVVALYEVHKILSRKLPANVVVSCLDVMRSGLVLDLTDRRAIAAAADIAVAHHLAMADTVFTAWRWSTTPHSGRRMRITRLCQG